MNLWNRDFAYAMIKQILTSFTGFYMNEHPLIFKPLISIHVDGADMKTKKVKCCWQLKLEPEG